jgi:hypothetical protein
VFNAQSFASAPRPPLRDQRSPAGYRHAYGEGELVDRGGTRFFARMHVFPVAEKTQTIVWIGNSTTALDGCRPEWNAFFASLTFPSVAVAAADSGPARGAAPAAPRAGAPPRTATEARGPMQFENVTFTAPAGWSVERAAGAVILTPSDARREEVLRVFMLAAPSPRASLAQELDRGWAEVATSLNAQLMRNVSGNAYDPEEPGRSARGWEYIRGTGGLRLADGSHHLTLYAIRAGDRALRVAVLAKDFRDNLLTTNASMNPRFEREIRELIFNLQFAGQPSPPANRPSVRGSGIVGVWAGMSMSLGSIKPQFAILFDNGTAFFGPSFPIRGLADIDPAIEQPAKRRYWGTWTARSGGAEITMPYGAIPVRVIGPALELTTTGTRHRFVRLAMPTGSLEGDWCLSEGQCLRLQPGGRFQDGGAVRILEHQTYAFHESPPQGAGRYELRDHSLILRYDAGPEIRIAFPGLADDPAVTPRDLMVGFNLDLMRRTAR